MVRTKWTVPTALLLLCGVILQGQSPTDHAVVHTPDLFSAIRGQVPGKPPSASPFLTYEKGRDVRTRIAPGTSDVRLVYSGPAAFKMIPPPGVSYLEMWTRESAAVAIVRVLGLSGELTASGDWIESTVNAQVIEVLKPAVTGQLLDGQGIVAFRTSGGSVSAQGATITTETLGSEMLRSGGTYLVFFWVEADGTLRSSAYEQFEVTPAGLRPLDINNPPNAVNGDAAARLQEVRSNRSRERLFPKGEAR